MPLTLRHKPAVCVASIGLLVGSIGWLASSPSQSDWRQRAAEEVALN